MAVAPVIRALKSAATEALRHPRAEARHDEGAQEEQRQARQDSQRERRGSLGRALRLSLSQLALLPGSGQHGPTLRPRILRADLHRLIHALFEALRQGDEGLGLIDMGSGLDTLAGQAAEGRAPAGLQQAFAALMRDVRAGGLPDAPQPSLQQFLLTLRQHLGDTRDFSVAGNFLEASA